MVLEGLFFAFKYNTHFSCSHRSMKLTFIQAFFFNKFHTSIYNPPNCMQHNSEFRLLPRQLIARFIQSYNYYQGKSEEMEVAVG